MTFFKTEPTRTRQEGAVDLAAGRRAFVRSVGLMAAGAALAGGAVVAPAAAETRALSDADILNFALNLEYLEAEFYLRAAFGEGLQAADVGMRPGAVSGGRRVKFKSSLLRDYAEEIAADELAHVRFLRAGLGSAAVARPTIDFTRAFAAAGKAAGLGGKGGFDPFESEDAFLLGAFLFEDVGVTAYKGAARFLANKDFLEAAAGILAVEAYHAGEVRSLLIARDLLRESRALSDLRDAVDGSSDLDQPVALARKANVVPTDANGIAFGRTPQQVLNIVYLGGAANDFGFFPNRLNGAIR